ncbi:MAG TPA: DNA methyltransferase [Allosphingosinicella sp.]
MTVSPDDAGGKLQVLLKRLGYADDPDYRTDTSGLESPQLRYVLDTAFERISVVGALCPRAPLAGDGLGGESGRCLPVVYVVEAHDADDAGRRHRAVWSQSVVPQIIMALPGGFYVANGYDYRQAGPLHPWSELDGQDLPATLTPLTAIAIRSSASWSNFAIGNRVDTRIARDIRNLSAKVRNEQDALRNRQDVVNTLIGRLLYLYVLIDRRIVDQDWVDGIVDDRDSRLCPTIRLDEGYGSDQPYPKQWPAEEVWHLFDAIDEVLNGSVFPIQRADRKLVTSEAMHLIRRVLRSDEADEGGNQQFAFIDVDYSTIRTETISAIYECFFEMEAAGQRKQHGAFYTPPFLVDYVLQEADRIRALESNSRVVDPACGSGAFLVAAYRHILERLRCKGTTLDVRTLRAVLTDCIRGIELKEQAANVARFSLYLTMLDYLPGRTLASLHKELGEERLFPDLSANVVTQDVFELLPSNFQREATHVLGNPPWKKAQADTPAFSYSMRLIREMNDSVVDERSLAELFYWRGVRDIAAPKDAVIAFVIPTKCFIAPAANHFPHAVASRTRIHGIVNLTSFRRKLFQEAEEAAMVIFASPEPPDTGASGWRFSPKLSSQPIGRDGRPWAIVIDRGQVEHFHQTELLIQGHQWYRDLLLQPLDRRLANALETTGRMGRLLNVGQFLRVSGMHVTVGETHLRTGLPSEYVLGTSASNDYRVRLGLRDPALLRDDERETHGTYELPDYMFDRLSDRMKTMFGGPTMLLPRSQAGADVVGRAAYNASIQGIYFTDDTVPADRRRAVLQEFSAYLRTAVARYLISVFGRQWIADQRRFETPDLKQLPFPYADYRELLDMPVSGFIHDGRFNEEEFAKFAADRFGAPGIFVQAVAEHRKLREPFQNGKRASSADTPVDHHHLQIYEAAIDSELRQLLAGTPLEVRSFDVAGPRREVQIVLAPDPSGIPPIEDPVPLADLASEAYIDLRDHGTFAVARILKPDSVTAWTAERAYSDAVGVAHRIMAG